MEREALAERRLDNQRLTRPGPRRPADVVAWLGAVQAQEYPAARWGLAQRTAGGTTDAEIRRAFDAGRILRTHVLRPTWHFVTPVDISWMLQLTAPRVQRIMSHYYRRLELNAATLVRAAGVMERALADRRYLTRPELGVRLGRDGIDVKGLRLAMSTIYAELEGVICSGPRAAKQLTYALLADRAPRGTRLSRDEALGELTRRYFRSHGPATIRDFVWWSGLTTVDAKRGLEMNDARQENVEGLHYWTVGRRARSRPPSRPRVHLLPVYDEYLVAHRDRDAVPHRSALNASGRGGPLTFQNPLVIDGQVAGVWRPVRQANGMCVEVTARKLTAQERTGLAEAAERYGRFLEEPVSLATRS